MFVTQDCVPGQPWHASWGAGIWHEIWWLENGGSWHKSICCWQLTKCKLVFFGQCHCNVTVSSEPSHNPYASLCQRQLPCQLPGSPVVVSVNGTVVLRGQADGGGSGWPTWSRMKNQVELVYLPLWRLWVLGKDCKPCSAKNQKWMPWTSLEAGQVLDLHI